MPIKLSIKIILPWLKIVKIFCSLFMRSLNADHASISHKKTGSLSGLLFFMLLLRRGTCRFAKHFCCYRIHFIREYEYFLPLHFISRTGDTSSHSAFFIPLAYDVYTRSFCQAAEVRKNSCVGERYCLVFLYFSVGGRLILSSPNGFCIHKSHAASVPHLYNTSTAHSANG